MARKVARIGCLLGIVAVRAWLRVVDRPHSGQVIFAVPLGSAWSMGAWPWRE